MSREETTTGSGLDIAPVDHVWLVEKKTKCVAGGEEDEKIVWLVEKKTNLCTQSTYEVLSRTEAIFRRFAQNSDSASHGYGTQGGDLDVDICFNESTPKLWYQVSE
ncbi:hypothetical protein L3Y34_010471 [Caenorhabditis briggsae]|uniref:Uncharacterized protein n=1 Tax=Caenorhabditis briggsae TaxID=6238 RepID=A0AAE8ZTN0_CAEBR|nr:hypothetical protein L3Y34_010465 [Caenorhabditis briggsae]ULT79889.1 hypothetical protein L3Y34_010467 [Caenorhabditis briggsae]ULT79891.1 hypothetical protein L3Y34_010469 [Caenorhabditis briggsae]ULT79893.1 hypothetical protein L3Y34_010471 [Caenorhabditis briggsae]